MTPLAPLGARAGSPVTLAHGLTVLLAPNPSPMTGPGTNTFLVGDTTLAIIDPGPDDPAHFAALIAAIGNRPVSHIFVTHSHLDHSPLARPLATLTGALIYAFGDSNAERSPMMEQLAVSGGLGGGEGVDHDFQPDICVQDQQTISGAFGTVTCLHTPGHMANHISLVWKNCVFCGDHVMAWSTSLISPPNGDLTAFMTSCEKLKELDQHSFYPAHGDVIAQPIDRLDWLMAHRRSREAQVIAALKHRPATAFEIAQFIYTDLDPRLLRAAESNVLAHLLDLLARGFLTTPEPISRAANFALIRPK